MPLFHLSALFSGVTFHTNFKRPSYQPSAASFQRERTKNNDYGSAHYSPSQVMLLADSLLLAAERFF
jgi:hypothetical protein